VPATNAPKKKKFEQLGEKISKKMWVEIFYLIGSVLYIPASVLLYWQDYTLPSTILYIVAGGAFLAGGIVDIAQKRRLITVLYFVGGIAFFAGSFFFLSPITVRAGIWIFRVGSVHYVVGSVILIVTMSTPRDKRRIIATGQYICGSCLFITGGILSETGVTSIAFATVWTVGSVAFTGAAIMNILLTTTTRPIAGASSSIYSSPSFLVLPSTGPVHARNGSEGGVISFATNSQLRLDIDPE
jgi:hypothetical protein